MTCFSSGNFRRPRTVVHLNIADFAVAVERQVDVRLRGRPVIIAQDCAARALVHDMSEEAYQSGVRKAMPIRLATRRCRDAVVLSPHPDRYERAMQDLFQEVCRYSPLVEPGAVDGHFFIDITGTDRLFGPPVDVARHMHRAIRNRFGLSPIWSVAASKLISKVASRLVKPVGEYVVACGEEQNFISPLPMTILPGIDATDRVRLADLNLCTAGQVAGLGEDGLAVLFGKRAGSIFDTVRGIDASPVTPAGQKSEQVIASRAFGEDTIEIRPVEGAVYELVEVIGAALRGRSKAARRLSIILEYADGGRCCRQKSVLPHSANDISLFETARSLVSMAWTRRVRVRRVVLSCPGPVRHQPQRKLFGAAAQTEKNDALIGAVDHIRERFGRGAVRMGRTMGTPAGGENGP